VRRGWTAASIAIAAWRAHAKPANLRAPTQLDASQMDWQLAERGLPQRFTAIFCANVVHIALARRMGFASLS